MDGSATSERTGCINALPPGSHSRGTKTQGGHGRFPTIDRVLQLRNGRLGRSENKEASAREKMGGQWEGCAATQSCAGQHNFQNSTQATSENDTTPASGGSTRLAGDKAKRAREVLTQFLEFRKYRQQRRHAATIIQVGMQDLGASMVE
ncbi:hypothetical protein BSKO_05362 [Bryopsis sp. KO-2023]|nr:hypothetical protein BSKO_05362 [Bryopsis sp. KO-2023]